MDALIAKFRRRAVSLGPRTGARNTARTRDGSIQAPLSAPTLSTATPSGPFLQQKIHPDVNSLLERYSMDGGTIATTRTESVHSEGKIALSPSRASVRQRRHSMDSATLIRDNLKALSEADEVAPLTPPSAEAQRAFAAHHRQLTSSSEWATFGRIHGVTRADTSASSPLTRAFEPDLSGQGKKTPNASAQDISLGSESSGRSHILKPSTTPPSNRAQLQRTSHAEIPWVNPQYTSTPRSSVSTSQSQPSNHQENLAASTPHTFGHPTPPQSNFSIGVLSEFGVISMKPKPLNSEWFDDPPPLPPLDHPAFRDRIRAGHRESETAFSAYTSRPAPFTFTSRYLAPHQRSQKPNFHRASRSVPTLPFARPRKGSRPPSRNKERFGDVSRASLPVQGSGRQHKISTSSRVDSPYVPESKRALSFLYGRVGSSARRSVEEGGTSTRRSSAEWSAHHASMIGGEQEEWPAQVSREILRISGMLPPANSGHHHDNDRQSRNGISQFSARPSRAHASTSHFSGADIFNSHRDFTEVRGYTMASRDTGVKATDPRKGKGKEVASGTSSVPQTPRKILRPTGATGTDGRHSSKRNEVYEVAGDMTTPNRSKRKADESEHESSPEGTPPDKKGSTRQAGGRTTSFAADVKDNDHRHGSMSRAPSSYRRKRARLSAGPSSDLNFGQEGSGDSNTSIRPPSRAASQAASAHSQRPRGHTPINRPSSRQSMSGASIPISALLSPHAPSISRSSTFHMRDPRRPPKKLSSTRWSLQFPEKDEPGSGSPIHAWFFFIGFIVFPLWWVASFWKTPETRRLMGDDQEKAVVVDDPQVEYDAQTWRFRCRIMSAISLLTYIPFIVLVAVFARKKS